MFILDSLMISGLRWTLQTVTTAAETEMNDDGALREQLLEAEMRREAGEISEAQFSETETSLLRRIREIRERREGGSGPLGFQGPTAHDEAVHVSVEAALTGDFHQEPAPPAVRRPGLVEASGSSPGRPGEGEKPASRPGATATARQAAKKPRRTTSVATPTPRSSARNRRARTRTAGERKRRR